MPPCGLGVNRIGGAECGAVDKNTFSFSDALPSLVATTSFLAAFFFPFPACTIQLLRRPLAQASMPHHFIRTTDHTPQAVRKVSPFNFAPASESVSLTTYARKINRTRQTLQKE